MKKLKGFKIFAADKIHPAGISILTKAGFNVIQKYGLSNSGLIDFIGNNSNNDDFNSCLIIRSVRTFSEIEIKKLSSFSIKTICTASSGFDNLPVQACRKHSIRILNVPDGNYISAAEHTMALLLNIMKNIVNAHNDLKSGFYDSLKYNNFELYGKTVGIIGVGRVGSHVAKICKAFGAKIIGNDIKKSLVHFYKCIEFTELDKLIKLSDIVTVHTPLDDTTRNLVDSKKLRLLKKNSILINCARGGIVNEKSLIHCLKTKKFYYAGIDVFENEPEINSGFLKLENIVLTPHLAGKTVESKIRISKHLAQNIIDFYTKKYT